MGIAIMAFKGQLYDITSPGFSLPSFTAVDFKQLWHSLVLAGFAQIPLTLTNAVIATASLVKVYWPDRPVSEKKLSLTMGAMNLINPLLGGIPLCHGAGGLVGQYYFGARTGGTKIIEGGIELVLGLFLSGIIATVLLQFPAAIFGAMLLVVGLELGRLAKDVGFTADLVPMAATALAACLINMACGFISGIALYYLMQYYRKTKRQNAG